MKHHDRAASQQFCCSQYGTHGEHRRRADLSHAAACDWLDEHPFPCGGNLNDHLTLCQEAVSQRLGFFDPGSLMLIWSVLSALWRFYEWLNSDEQDAPRD